MPIRLTNLPNSSPMKSTDYTVIMQDGKVTKGHPKLFVDSVLVGTPNIIAKYSISGGFEETSAPIIEDGTNIAIGKNFANEKLDVNGNVNISGTLAVNDSIFLPKFDISPIGRSAGQIYYNTIDNNIYRYTGSSWESSTSSSGSFGSSGSSGSSGTSGNIGSSGTSGSTGSSGTSGSTGSSGTSGSGGSSGTSGSTGSSGTSGSGGSSGTSGSTGSSGTSGLTGSSGTSGANGIDGSSGTSGSSGSSGSSMLAAGTQNYVAKYSSASTIGNSGIVDNLVVDINKSLLVDGFVSSSGNIFGGALFTSICNISSYGIEFPQGANRTIGITQALTDVNGYNITIKAGKSPRVFDDNRNGGIITISGGTGDTTGYGGDVYIYGGDNEVSDKPGAVLLAYDGSSIIGKIGIGGGTHATGILKVWGTGYFTGDVIAYDTSDRRLKDNLVVISDALDKINIINGYTFTWNRNQVDYSGTDVGVLADEIERILPEIVTTRENGFKAVKYERIIPLLIQGMKEQQIQINEMKKIILEIQNASK